MQADDTGGKQYYKHLSPIWPLESRSLILGLIVTEMAPVRTGKQKISPAWAATTASQEAAVTSRKRRSSYEYEENRQEA
jgi:hypothetical protein